VEPLNIGNTPTLLGSPVVDAQGCTLASAAGDDVLKDLEVRIQSMLGSRIRDFQIIAAVDGLILSGSSSSWYVKQLAQHAVMEALRIGIRSNQIVVQE
jgi:hypothetical protein